MKNNRKLMKNPSRNISRIPRIIEVMIALSFVFGIYMKSDFMTILQYMSSLVAQLLFLFYAIRLSIQGRYVDKENIVKYLSIITCILVILISFISLHVESNKIVNRILPLIAMFGVSIVGDKKSGVNCSRIIHIYITIYSFFSILINLDFIWFNVFGSAIWKPTNYLGFRCRGPFGDPNFLAIYSATALIIVFFLYKEGVKRNILLISLGLNILFAMSIFAFAFISVSLVFHIVIKKNKSKSIVTKQWVILGLYFGGMFFYWKLEKEIFEVATFILAKIYGDLESAIYKYSSLTIRLEAQLNAMSIVLKQWWGQGPLQVKPMLGMDPHNSYIGIIFEQGILGLFLVFLSLTKRCRTKAVDCVSTYLMLSALMLNVHLTSLYSLYIVLQYVDRPRIELVMPGEVLE